MVRVRFALVGQFNLIERCRSIFLGYSYMKYPTRNKYHIRALCPFLDFLVGINKRLATRGSRLGLAGLQNSLPQESSQSSCKNYESLIRCMTAPVSVDSNFLLNILDLTLNSAHK